jgi:hypothetical protein
MGQYNTFRITNKPLENPMMTAHNEINILKTSATLTFANRWDHFLARLRWKRMQHKVAPGLYAIGNPTRNSLIFVTANYTLSFDALRVALDNMDGYILVLDTKGVNVWCAAGEGTFGTDELVLRIDRTRLSEVTDQRVLILPQLGAPGITAHEVKQRSGFRVEYGPVRASDLPEYLKTRQATPQMRQVRFNLWDRMVLIPVELVATALPTLVLAIILYFLLGWQVALSLVAAVLAGTLLFPILLPWLPTSEFSTQGFILGMVVVVPFALVLIPTLPGPKIWQIIQALPLLMIFPSLTAYLTLNFTGSTPFTSRSGVKQEIFSYIPVMAWLAGSGIALGLIALFVRLIGG